jgi:hypothetical protein
MFRSMSAVLLAASALTAQEPTPPAGQPPAQQPTAGQQGPGARRPRPYAQVINERAKTERGGITVHKVDERWFLEVPDSLASRDFLLVSRIAGVPTGLGGFTSSGQSLEERVVRWQRVGDRVLLRSIEFGAVADDSLPISLSVASNNYAPILASFPVQAYTRDSTGYVLDVTDFFGGDTPAISGLDPGQRRQYQVRRLDPARSYVSGIRAFPTNVEVRHVQTFDAAAAPSDASANTISLEMRQSLLLLPKVPMRPRYADDRVGIFSLERVNYGLDQQKAATQKFAIRWRLEPKDPAAYARGELVEPVKPITYYIDPATPARWRRYVKEGVEQWQTVFEKAGFKHAIVAKDPPSKSDDPNWDPDDARYSVVRWAASLVRNAVGPHTHDPRTGEILNSEITWYHNHMRSYRNRLMIETGAANPEARTLEIPEDLMGETMRQVITHEIGHALGLPHNMIASASIPVDSLRSATFTSKYGVSLTIMDYARQNYVAQPGDNLKPKDFVRRLGPFDEFAINWGYRVFPQARTPEDERPILNKLVLDQKGMFAYRYLPQQYSGIDPRNQTEDLSDDQVRATAYALANMKKVVPQLVSWTTRAGDDFDDLNELYGEALGMWSLYMGHVTNWIGGVYIDLKTADQNGAVYHVVPKARQKTALAFLNDNVFNTPRWLEPQDILSRLGQITPSLETRQSNVISALLDARRLGRLADAEEMSPAQAYPLAEYLDDLRHDVWTSNVSDANRRTMQRVYIERLALLVNPPALLVQAGGPFGGGGGFQGPVGAFLAAPNVPRSDLPALARSQLRAIKAQARTAASAPGASAMGRAHWNDIADRVDAILEPPKR